MFFGAGCSSPLSAPPTAIPVTPQREIPVQPVKQAPPSSAVSSTVPAVGLKTFTDPVYGVRVSYPATASFKTEGIEADGWVAPGSRQIFLITDPSNKHIYSPLILSVWTGRNAEADCYAKKTQQGPLTETLVINGVTFKTGYWNDAGAGGLWEGPIYRTFRDGICYHLGYTIETHSDGSPEYEKIRTDAQQEIPRYFDPIIKSITFVK